MTFSMQPMRCSMQTSDEMCQQISVTCDSKSLTNSFTALNSAFLLISSLLVVLPFAVLRTSLLRLLAA